MNTAPWNKFHCFGGTRGEGAPHRYDRLSIWQVRVNWEDIIFARAGSIIARDSHFTTGEKAMMMDWNQYHKEVGARIGDLMKVSPDTVRGYQTLSAANSKASKLGEKTRQLISLAVAVTTRCDGCIVVHTDAALKAGATKEEIAEALGVAVSMNAGAALVYSSRVLDAVDAKSAATHAG